MSATSSKQTNQANAEHHTKAAECCNKAAAEHTNAAKCCVNGDEKKAIEHAKNAHEHCTKAQDHGKHAKAA